ncbi:hypothetical protein [Ottowia caeni]|uniref:hypothetical protein n=1 Tax=Ottowia caeni TaxID=2870339 RepID=UPI001E59E09C|nr:hypothetical protein [Ottowia caeni]
MQTKTIALATVLATALAGNAFAFQPVSGEGPLFQNDTVTVSTVSREAVRQEAAANPPAAGVNNAGAAVDQTPSKLTRAEVREDVRNAMANGYVVKSGERS